MVSGCERETIITFNEMERTAEVFTYNKKIRTKLLKCLEEHPDECKLVKENQDGGITFIVDKSWIKVAPKRRVSEEQREKLRERAKRMWSNNELN